MTSKNTLREETGATDYAATPGVATGITTPGQPANSDSHFNVHYIPPFVPFGKSSPNKLMTRKRKRSHHPLRDLRLQRGYTLEELANLTELSPSYLSRLESGTRRLNADILQRLAHILSCHPGDLLPMDTTSGKFTLMTRTDGAEGAHTRFAAPDLPMYVLAAANDTTRVIQFDTPADWIARPSDLTGVAGAISFSIPDTALTPRFRPGERLFAHPNRPLTPNCTVLAITHENQAILGEFTGWKQSGNENETLMIRVNPGSSPMETTLTTDKVKALYRIIGMMEAA